MTSPAPLPDDLPEHLRANTGVSARANVRPLPGAPAESAAAQSLPGQSLLAALGGVTSVLDFDTDDINGLDDDSLLTMTRLVEAWSRKIAGLQVACAGVITERSVEMPAEDSLAEKYGYPNEKRLLQTLTLASARDIATRIRLGRQTATKTSLIGQVLPARYPQLRRALDGGLLSLPAATVIAKTLDEAHDVSPDLVSGAESGMLEAATGQDFGTGTWDPLPPEAMDPLGLEPEGLGAVTPDALPQRGLEVLCKAWEQVLDPDGAEPEDHVAFLQRGITFGKQKNGLVPMRGNVLPELAATLQRMSDAIHGGFTIGSPVAELVEAHGGASPFGPEPEYGAPSTQEGQGGTHPQLGDDATGAATDDEDAPRAHWYDLNFAQRMHDTLGMVASVAAKSPKVPHLGGAPVTVLIEAKQEDLLAGRGGWIHGADGLPAPISHGSLSHAICTGAVRQVVRNQTSGKIESLVTVGRIFNHHQRLAIAVRDGGCVIPGCLVPPSKCEIHHVQPHALGGPTDVDNGVMLCPTHHRMLGHSWDVRMKDGYPQVKAPRWQDRTETWRTPRPVHRYAHMRPLPQKTPD